MPKDQIQEGIQKRARGAVIAYAFFRWESAVTIGLTLLLAVLYPDPFPWWRWYMWVAIGVVAEALIVITSITDQRTADHVVSAIFREQHQARGIRTPKYREGAERALDYQARIERSVAGVKGEVLRDRLQRAGRGVAEWVSYIFKLARRLDDFESNEVIHKDMQDVPLELKTLDARLKLEDDPEVRAELMRALEQKRSQWENLRALQNTMETAEVRLDSTLTALGTVYSQVLLLSAKGGEGAAERLTSDIADQVSALQDIITTMDDVLRN